jgi:hypothetical protein
VTVHSRVWLAAAVGLWMAHPLVAAEPARLSVTPHQSVTPRPTASPNQQVANTIADHLRQSGQLHRYEVEVSYRDGLAELTGRVTDQLQREEVLRIVQGVPGVERVRDRLTLTGLGPVTQAQAVTPPTAEMAPRPRVNGGNVEPMPIYQAPPTNGDLNPPKMPPYAWPTYAPYNNASRIAYPTLYPYQSWPFIGPMYPFPKVPLGWRAVKLEWNDGHWWYSKTACGHDWWRVRYW